MIKVVKNPNKIKQDLNTNSKECKMNKENEQEM
jgi:hypothetical protein